jgi:hypothetical protein
VSWNARPVKSSHGSSTRTESGSGAFARLGQPRARKPDWPAAFRTTSAARRFGPSNAWALRVQPPWRWSATARNRSIDGTRSPTKGCSRKAHRSSLLSMPWRRPQRRSGPSVSLRTLERERQRFEAAPNSWTLGLDRFGFMVVDFLKIFSGTRVCGAQSRKVHCMGQAARRGTREMSLFRLCAWSS